jgi:hypothetical protein
MTVLTTTNATSQTHTATPGTTTFIENAATTYNRLGTRT